MEHVKLLGVTTDFQFNFDLNISNVYIKCFHASCSKLGDDELLRIESGDGACIVQTVKLTVVFAVALS